MKLTEDERKRLMIANLPNVIDNIAALCSNPEAFDYLPNGTCLALPDTYDKWANEKNAELVNEMIAKGETVVCLIEE